MTFWEVPNCTQMTVGEPILRELGRTVAYQSLLESAMSHFIGSLLSLGHCDAQIVTAELSSRQLRAILMSTLAERLKEDPESLERAKDLMKRTGNFEQRRNALAHSLYWHGGDYSENTATRFKTTARESRGLKVQHETVDVEELRELAIEAGRCHHELVMLEIEVCGIHVPHYDLTAHQEDMPAEPPNPTGGEDG